MDLNEYQREALKTAVFPKEGKKIALSYCGVKLCGHEGKVFEAIKAEERATVQELGDTLWYLAVLADLFGYTLSEIAEMNITKLRDRQERGVLKGSGDAR